MKNRFSSAPKANPCSCEFAAIDSCAELRQRHSKHHSQRRHGMHVGFRSVVTLLLGLLVANLVAARQVRGEELFGAYSLQGGKWPQQSAGDPVTITYSYQNLLDGGLKRADGTPLTEPFLRQSIEEALGLWADYAPLHFVEVPDQGGTPALIPYPDGQFGQIRFSHIFMNGPDVPGQPPKSKAQAFFPTAGGNLGGDVFFDRGDPWEPIGQLDKPDVLGAAVHEIGHSLGIGHSNVSGANMYWIFLRTNGLGTAYLHDDDIAAIQAIYGAGVGSVTPLMQIPEPASLFIFLIGSLGVVGLRRSRR